MLLNSFYKKFKITNKHCLVGLGAIVTLGTAFSPGLYVNPIKNETDLNQNSIANKQWIAPLNPINESDIKYVDIRDWYSDPTLIWQIKYCRNGNNTLINFLHLFYSEFLNPLLKANPELPIPPEPAHPEGFFIRNDIEQSYGILANYDSESFSNPWPGDPNDPSIKSPTSPYPVTAAVIKLLNVLLSPLDQQLPFQQLAAKIGNTNWNPKNGFFAQFTDYLLTQQLNAELGWHHYQPGANGTSLNIGMFDFDAGSYVYRDEGVSKLYWVHTLGIDTNNQAIKTLSDQMNNLMFLLANYVNSAASLLNNLENIIPDPFGQWLMLNNLTTFGAFQTPQLFDLAAKSDGWNLLYNDDSLATIFTGLPRFMVNASYGDCPDLHRPTREWNNGVDNNVQPLLHYNGLISGYLRGAVEYNDFVHSSPENKGHYWTYADTNNLNNLQREQISLGEMMFGLAWNAEIIYLATSEPVIFNNICMNAWPSTKSSKIQGALITKNDFLLQDSDKNQASVFTPDSIQKRLMKAFNKKAAPKIISFTMHFNAIQATYDQYHYGFMFHTNGVPITYQYFVLAQLETLSAFSLQALNLYTSFSFEFKNEQTNLLTAYSQNLTQAYKTIDLNYHQHANGKALLYQFPNLATDDPKLHQCTNKNELYNFYLSNTDEQGSYYQHFKAEQLTIRQEHQYVPNNQNHKSALQWWIISFIIFGLVMIGLIFCFCFYRFRRQMPQ